ncbi:MAG: hypothetical protein JNK66_00800 [Chitinophagales bacterium]|nr:hypothetical protein [Chitinophagales bacterium]
MQVTRHLPTHLLLVKTPNNGLARVPLRNGEDQQRQKIYTSVRHPKFLGTTYRTLRAHPKFMGTTSRTLRVHPKFLGTAYYA